MKTLKKGDIILITILLFISIIGLIAFFNKSAQTVIVKSDNKTVYSGKLNVDKEIKLTHNTVVVKNNKAFMKCSDCKNQICVKTGKITKSGETVICLPNKVIIEIK